MELYTKTSYELSRVLTLRYSTSFGSSTMLFHPDIRSHIFAIYGLVRVADEIVDTYNGQDKDAQLDVIENATYAAIESGYSSNPIVHAFAQTARKYKITRELLAPFFASMRMDLTPQTYTDKAYEEYIYGSAEVIGLMCLRVFVTGDSQQYDLLAPGAKTLGAAYQKVNFLRDIASDFNDRQRVYFPGVTFESFDETSKQAILKDIEKDFSGGYAAIMQLPVSSRRAVALSYNYYFELFKKLKDTPAEILKRRRVRVSTARKIFLRALHTTPSQKSLS